MPLVLLPALPACVAMLPPLSAAVLSPPFPLPSSSSSSWRRFFGECLIPPSVPPLPEAWRGERENTATPTTTARTSCAPRMYDL